MLFKKRIVLGNSSSTKCRRGNKLTTSRWCDYSAMFTTCFNASSKGSKHSSQTVYSCVITQLNHWRLLDTAMGMNQCLNSQYWHKHPVSPCRWASKSALMVSRKTAGTGFGNRRSLMEGLQSIQSWWWWSGAWCRNRKSSREKKRITWPFISCDVNQGDHTSGHVLHLRVKKCVQPGFLIVSLLPSS